MDLQQPSREVTGALMGVGHYTEPYRCFPYGYLRSYDGLWEYESLRVVVT